MIGQAKLRGASCAALAILFGICPFASAQGDRCGAGKDLVVQALERIGPESGNEAFQDALELLKHAVAECSDLGDAWVYRSLVEKRLGHDALAVYSMNKARFFNSDALAEDSNPLVLATPSQRGFGAQDTAPQSQAPAAPPQPPGPVQQKWALVVGIGHFTDSQVPQLHYTTSDADAFASLLENPSAGRFPATHVHVLTDAQATTKNIKEQLNWIARHAQRNDLVVIYVATHGTSRSMDSAGGANYLITYDTQAYSAGGYDEDALYATAYPMVELADAVATRMKALRTVVFLDTCYSGGSIAPAASSQAGAQLNNTSPSTAMLDKMSEGTGRIVMAASQVNEESLESGQLQHGFFTYYLLQALASSHGDTPLSQIYRQVAQQVEQRASALGSQQHPVLSRSSPNADFALGVTGAAPVAAAQ